MQSNNQKFPANFKILLIPEEDDSCPPINPQTEQKDSIELFLSIMGIAFLLLGYLRAYNDYDQDTNLALFGLCLLAYPRLVKFLKKDKVNK